ncbi:MAG: Fic family protein [Chitinophagales bacterium]|nr:Fic family protein [Chitinophagales bacterium]MCZ2393263.1 Fic family protein [Chitinophagales bacterium]
MKRLSFVSSKYFEKYNSKQPITLIKHFNKLKAIGRNSENFNFYFSNSAVYSSMIEGNVIDFDSYLRYSYSGMNNTGKSFKEIEDLKKAYSFAKEHELNLKNFLKCHEILSETIIEDKKYRGSFRDKDVYVFSSGKKIFTGAGKEIVKTEVERLFDDIGILVNRDLTINQVFYYASMLHLIFVQIHPLADGNGRCSRLLEKWFLSEKLGANAWFIQSERLYQKRKTSYYKNVHIGDSYNNINYDYSIPFLLMLPMALRLK